VQALHDDKDGTGFLVIEARHQGAAVPIDHAFAGHFRPRLLGLERVIDDDEVGPAPGERAADRGSIAAAPPLW
jgi:hypothetical protein